MPPADEDLPDGTIPGEGEVRVLFPPNVPVLTPSATLHIRGTARATQVLVNGEPATWHDGYTTWSYDLALVPGENRFVVSTVDGETQREVTTGHVIRTTPPASAPDPQVFVAHWFLGFDATHPELLHRFEQYTGALHRFDLAYEHDEPVLASEDVVAVRATLAGDTILLTGPSGLSLVNTETGHLQTVFGDVDEVPNALSSGVLPGGRALVDLEGELVAVDLATGQHELVSGRTRGTGPRWSYSDRGALDLAEDRALIMTAFDDPSGCRVIAVSLSTGDRSCPYTLLDASAGRITEPRGRTVFYTISDYGEGTAIVALDLVSGESRVVSNFGSAFATNSAALMLVYDSRHDLLVMSDIYMSAPILIDPVSGQRVLPGPAN